MRRITYIILLNVLELPVGSHAQTLTVDPSFGSDGVTILQNTGPALFDRAECAVIHSNQQITVIGRTVSELVLYRLSPSGNLIQGFGDEGLAIHDLGDGVAVATSAVLDAEGRIVVGGYLGGSATDPFTARFLTNGELDPSYNGTGVLIRSLHASGSSDRGAEVMVQPDGKIILVGQTGPNSSSTEIFVERYLEDGTLDDTFAGDGSLLLYLSTANDERALAATLDTDGDILIAGGAFTTGPAYERLLVAKVDSNGDQVSDFGEEQGYTLVPSPIGGNFDVIARTIAVAPDGTIYIGGEITVNGPTSFILGFHPDGTLNGFQSTLDTAGENSVATLYVDPLGRIVSGGKRGLVAGTHDWIVNRFIPDGAGSGSETLDLGVEEECLHLTPFGNGDLLGVGRISDDGQDRIAVVKYLAGLTTGIGHAPLPSVQMSAMPNPVESTTTLTFTLTKDEQISISLYDPQGRLVRSYITRSDRPAGDHREVLDLSGLASGAYRITLATNDRHIALPIVKP